MLAFNSYLQLSRGLGICKNHENDKHLKRVKERHKLRLLSISLSSRATRQDSWTVHLADSIRRPVHSVPCNSNAFKSHCFLLSDQALQFSGMKTTCMRFARSYNALQSNPLFFELVPAVGIIIFAVWGIGPLMRHGRNLVLHKSETSWKKSGTYYVMISYLQPLLLWTGTAVICRALDHIILPLEASQVVKQRFLNFVRSLSTVLAFAYCLSSVVQQAQKFFLETKDPNDARNMGFHLAGKAIYSAVWVAAASLFMELLGFSTKKWLTAGGLGTVLLTLAGREIFINFLSSAMIHATRPFVVSEWIQTKIEGYEVSGTVEHVGWWSPTIIRGEDREAVHIPNHKFTVNVVRNLSQKNHWRIKTHLAISHLDVNKINIIVADMRKVLAKNPHVEQQRLHRRVFLENINPENQALLILISCFVKTSHYEEYLCVKEAILLDLLRVISHHRARLATPIRTVQKIYSDTDLESKPFSEPAFTRGVAPNRPLLLIEPSYKINGEVRAKGQPRSGRTNREQDAKTGSHPSPDAKSDAKVGSSSRETPKTEAKPDAKGGGKQNFDAKEQRAAADPNAGDGVVTEATPKPLSKTGGAFPSTSQTKQDGDLLVTQSPKCGPISEENIVLGVALERPKKALPMEEEVSDSGSRSFNASRKADKGMNSN